MSPKLGLLKRESCTVPVDLDFDKHGTCVDTSVKTQIAPGHS
jgi:hypothetical protein